MSLHVLLNLSNNTGAQTLRFYLSCDTKYFEIEFFGVKTLCFCHINLIMIWTSLHDLTKYVKHKLVVYQF